MEISKLSDSSFNTSSRQLLPIDLFKQLSQLGSIEARVASISKGQALLNSQLGQILSVNTLDLKTGDRLQIRAGGNEQVPVLKVSKLAPQATILNAAANQNLAKVLTAAKPVAALIVSQQSNNTIIQLGDQRIIIPAQPDLKSGQLISVEKSADGKNIEIRPVNHLQVLKSAINQLLPQQARHQQPASLTQLVKLIQNISSTNYQPTAAAETNKGQGTNVFSQLEALIGSLPQLSKLDKTTIQQWVRYILPASQDRSDQAHSVATPYQLLQQLPKLEGSVGQQLRQWAQSLASTTGSQVQITNTGSKSIPDDLLLHTSREIIKLVDQSLGQQLLQQTSLRYQQELQQPLALSIAIPLNDQQKVQEMRLKIRQRKSEAGADKQSWDIHLDFEFGLLGLISTHLLLDDGRLSASFWSGNPETRQNIDSNLPDFKAQISRAGFDLGQFHSFPGKPPETNEHDKLDLPSTLLDIRV